MLRLKGSQVLRQRLVLATLTGRALRIDAIRASDQNPGLQDYEANLLRLLEKITSGCVVEINETGTSLRYKPGFVVGGDVTHDCGTSRSLGYYLEPVILIGLFGRKPLRITLRGITNDNADTGIDVWRTVTLPFLRNFTELEELESLQLEVRRRGCAPLGGGEVSLIVPTIQALPYINRKEEGLVKRIRGIAFSAKVSPQMSNRLVDGARGVLNTLLADVFIFTDHVGGTSSGLSPGYGLTLVAETTAKNLISAEIVSDVLEKGDNEQMLPEEVGKRAAYALLDQIDSGGVVDSSHQVLAIMLCALGAGEVNQVRVGSLTPHAIRVLRTIKEILGVTFSVKPDSNTKTVYLSCVGAAVKNMARKAT